MPTGDERVPLTALHWGSTPGRGRNLPGVAGCRRAPARGDRADRLEPDRRQGSLLERLAPFSGRRSWGTLAVMAGSPCPRSSSSVSCSGCCRRCAVTDGSASGRCCCWRQRRVASRRLPASSRRSRDRAQTGLPLPPRLLEVVPAGGRDPGDSGEARGEDPAEEGDGVGPGVSNAADGPIADNKRRFWGEARVTSTPESNVRLFCLRLGRTLLSGRSPCSTCC